MGIWKCWSKRTARGVTHTFTSAELKEERGGREVKELVIEVAAEFNEAHGAAS